MSSEELNADHPNTTNGHTSSSSRPSSPETMQPPQPRAPIIPEQLRNVGRRSRETSRLLGTVKWFNAKSGYGFITRHDTHEDVFVHYSAIARKNPRHSMKSLGDGEIVEFNIMAASVMGPGGGPVRGNPYVSYIPIRRNDSFAAGDPGLSMPILRSRPRNPDYGNSRIPRWIHHASRNYNY